MAQDIILIEKEVRTYVHNGDDCRIVRTNLGSTACRELATALRFMHSDCDCFHTSEPSLHYEGQGSNLYRVYVATRTNDEGQNQEFEWHIFSSMLF